MSRYPRLPQALLALLESGPWTGTPTELYAALEPYRAEPWPASAVSLSLWLRNHGGVYGIRAEGHHTGERRLLRLARAPNGLGTGGFLGNTAQYRAVSLCFTSWDALEAALPALVQSAAPGELYTLAVQVTPDLRLGRAIEARYLALATREWAGQFPAPLGLWLLPGCVSLGEWSPPE